MADTTGSNPVALNRRESSNLSPGTIYADSIVSLKEGSRS